MGVKVADEAVSEGGVGVSEGHAAPVVRLVMEVDDDREEIISILEEALAEAKAGQLHLALAFRMTRSGEQRVAYSGRHRTFMVGALMRAAMSIGGEE